jgi:hypothetical protein
MDARGVGVAVAAFAAFATSVPVAKALPQSPEAPMRDRHRIHVVRATDRTSVGGAEVFDLDEGDDPKKIWLRIVTALHPETEVVPIAKRLVADDDGRVELGPGRFHTLLARAPGWYQLRELVDFERMRGDEVELEPDDPLKIEIVDGRGDPVPGAMVELYAPAMCAVGDGLNLDWRAASDRDGRVFFPHYLWWTHGSLFGRGYRLALAIPLRDPPRLAIGAHDDARPFEVPSLRWQIPALSKIRVEFPGAEAVPGDRAISFELVGPMQRFGRPDRFASDHGQPVDVPTEIGVPLSARFHWREPDPVKQRAADLLAFGDAHSIEGGCALLRVPVASDPVAVRVRPVRGDGSTCVGRFDFSLRWIDRQGFRLQMPVESVAVDETGSLRIEWRRPRLEAGERPAKLRIALQKAGWVEDWEATESDDLASREVDWPVGESLDVGTLLVPGSD